MDKEILHSNEDVDAILKLAIRRNKSGVEDELRDRLQRSAVELGISESELDAAVEEYKLQKKATRFQKITLQSAQSHLIWSVVINLGLVVFWKFSKEDFFWPIFPIIFYLGTTLYHYWQARKPVDPTDQSFLDWLAAGEPSTWDTDPDERPKRVKA